jgi:hypothetical protein
MRRIALVLALASCGSSTISPSETTGLPAHRDIMLEDGTPARRRMVQPEVFLRAYLAWFGGLAPDVVQAQSRGGGLFDRWVDYLVALGLPDYQLDQPRANQSNTVMVAALGRLAEALCVRSVEHDLKARIPVEKRLVFAFEAKESPSKDEFAERLDVLHRTFLGYPLALASPKRVDRFYALHRGVASRHSQSKLSADETAWAAVCTALVQHPEAGLY